MTEYIEREAAIAETRKPRLTDAELRRRLASIPAADVQPVVRCGECIYFSLNSCMRWTDGTFMERTDFCSRAVIVIV